MMQYSYITLINCGTRLRHLSEAHVELWQMVFGLCTTQFGVCANITVFGECTLKWSQSLCVTQAHSELVLSSDPLTSAHMDIIIIVHHCTHFYGGNLCEKIT